MLRVKRDVRRMREKRVIKRRKDMMKREEEMMTKKMRVTRGTKRIMTGRWAG